MAPWADNITSLHKPLGRLLAKRLVAVLVSRLPFMAFGPLSWVAGYFFEKIIVGLIQHTFIGAQLALIDRTIDKRVSDLKSIADEIEKTDPKELKVKADEFDKKLSDSYNLLTRL